MAISISIALINQHSTSVVSWFGYFYFNSANKSTQHIVPHPQGGAPSRSRGAPRRALSARAAARSCSTARWPGWRACRARRVPAPPEARPLDPASECERRPSTHRLAEAPDGGAHVLALAPLHPKHTHLRITSLFLSFFLFFSRRGQKK